MAYFLLLLYTPCIIGIGLDQILDLFDKQRGFSHSLPLFFLFFYFWKGKGKGKEKGENVFHNSHFHPSIHLGMFEVREKYHICRYMSLP